jgi:hypothetical protein
MGSFANYLENKLLDHVVGKTSYTMPTAYIALCTADPTDAGSGGGMNEVADANNYARKSTAGGDWNAASGGAIDNANAITFNQASGSWGTVTHFAIVDSATHGAGNMLAHGALGASKTIDSGDTPEFAAGDIDITLD